MREDEQDPEQEPEQDPEQDGLDQAVAEFFNRMEADRLMIKCLTPVLQGLCNMPQQPAKVQHTLARLQEAIAERIIRICHRDLPKESF